MSIGFNAGILTPRPTKPTAITSPNSPNSSSSPPAEPPATQLVNVGAKITTIQALLGHQRLNTTMNYAKVHDKTVIEDYFRAMAQIEGEQSSVYRPSLPDPEKSQRLIEQLLKGPLNDDQRALLDQLRETIAPGR